MQIAQQGPRLLVRYRAPQTSVDGVRLPVLDVDLVWLAGAGDLKTAGTHIVRRVAPGELVSESLEPVPATGTTLRVFGTARTGKHVSAPTAIVSHTLQAVPSAPTAVKAERIGASVRVQWTAPDSSTRLRVYRRSEGETTSQPLAPEPTAAGVTSQDDGAASAALASCYTVRTVSPTNAVVESDDSSEACVPAPEAAPLEPPAGLAVVEATDALDLSWSPSSDARVARYRIYRAIGDGVPEVYGETRGSESTFRDTDPPRGERAVYTVTALGSDGSESAASAPATGRARVP